MLTGDTLNNFSDTLATTIALSEPIRVSLIEGSKTWIDKPLIMVVMTGVFTLIGVLIGQYLQHRTMKDIYNQQGWLNRDKELFVMRMNAYREIASVLSETYHVTLYKADGENKSVFPSAYVSYSYLRQWINNVTKMVDRNLLLIDQGTYKCFDEFNNMVLKHLSEIENCRKRKSSWDLVSRDLGRRDCGLIQNRNAEVLTACRNFIETKYNVELEHVR